MDCCVGHSGRKKSLYWLSHLILEPDGPCADPGSQLTISSVVLSK
jgi:hypothetical protein